MPDLTKIIRDLNSAIDVQGQWRLRGQSLIEWDGDYVTTPILDWTLEHRYNSLLDWRPIAYIADPEYNDNYFFPYDDATWGEIYFVKGVLKLDE